MENITLNHAITFYLEDLETRPQKAKKTLKSYRNRLRQFEALMHDSNVTLLKDVDEVAHALPYRDEMIGWDYSLDMVKTYVRKVKAFMSYAVVKSWIASSPFALVNVTGAEARCQPRIISQDQLFDLLYHVQNATLYNIFLIGGDAGLRINDILNLERESP